VISTSTDRGGLTLENISNYRYCRKC